MLEFAFPFGLGPHGNVASADYDDHIIQLIEQLVLTSPGERVNRPDFGCGVIQLVFTPSSNESALATRALIQGSLQRWLGSLIDIQAVHVVSGQSDGSLQINVQYVDRHNQQTRTISIQRAPIS